MAQERPDAATTNGHHWHGIAMSTGNAEAVACYDRGVVALVAGLPHAETHFADAVELDAGFLLGHVALGVAGAVLRRPYCAPPGGTTATRGERQHAEIVNTALALGDRPRAADLRREHLLEYPGDLLIVWLPAALCAARPA
jgi:hypothetical protein